MASGKRKARQRFTGTLGGPIPEFDYDLIRSSPMPSDAAPQGGGGASPPADDVAEPASETEDEAPAEGRQETTGTTASR